MNVTGTPTDPEQIRPLFMFPLVFTVISLLLVIFKLDVKHLGSGIREKRNAIKDAVAMVKADKNCLKWICMVGVGRLPQAMIIPYLQLYAAEIKGASVETLAAMTTATALTSVVCGYFVGVLSDKFGRKVTFFSTLSLYIVGLILLLTCSSPIALVIVGALVGFQEIGQVVSGSMQHELVPGWARGRWSGVNSFVGSMVGAAVAAVAGMIYDGIGAHWLFIIYIAC
jgi:MFS family permease